jgi:octaprenyl-diphosphate synthase
MSALPSPSAVFSSLARATARAGVGWIGLRLLRALEDALANVDHGEHVAGRAAAHLLGAPGKRVRPVLVLLGSRLGAAPGPAAAEAARELAVAAELVHAATLLHDDVIDEGETRRGLPTARVVYGNTASILAGDDLLVEALARIQDAGHPALLSDMLRVLRDMVAAEAEQLELRGRPVPDSKTWRRVAAGKTASLFGWCLAAGATTAGLDRALVDKLRGAGRDLGVAFQMVDDALDLGSDPSVASFPMTLAVERDPGLGPLLAGAAAGAGLTPALRDRVLATGCLEVAREEAGRLVAAALEVLTRLPKTPARNQIEALARAVVHRAA